MYKFYVNVDTDEVCQIFIDETKVDVPEWKEDATQEEKLRYAMFFSPYLDEIAGVWSDCYMPINLACELFGRYYVLPDEIRELNGLTSMPFDVGLAKNTSCIYRKMPEKIHLVQCRKHLTNYICVKNI